MTSRSTPQVIRRTLKRESSSVDVSWRWEKGKSYTPYATRWFLALLIFDPEDGGDAFLRNGSQYPRK
jgi:hypothetical protein